MNERMKQIIDENFEFFKFKYETITPEELESTSVKQEMDYVNLKMRSEKLKKVVSNIK